MINTEDKSMLSQTAEYALRAVLFLADHTDEAVDAGRIAKALGIPKNYLAKTLYALARAGVLHSGRGPAGGFRLAAAPSRIPLIRVVEPFDALEARRQCLLGNAVCSDAEACAAHAAWKDVSGRIAHFFRTTTVAELRGGRLTLVRGSSQRRTRVRSRQRS